MTTPDLHPADQAGRDRHHRAMNGPGGTMAPRCDHGRRIGECATCIQLTHAEQGSVAVRAAYAFGDWPPCADPGCRRPGPHVHHGAGDEPATEAPALAGRPFTGRAYGLRARLLERRRAS